MQRFFKQESERLLKEALPEQFHNYTEELNGYLCDSFGNSTRLDYGTGERIAYFDRIIEFICRS